MAVTTAQSEDRAITDPVGLIVDLITAAESTLEREQIRPVVTTVTGGRAKARRLACALVERP